MRKIWASAFMLFLLLPIGTTAQQVGEELWIDGPSYGASANWDECSTHSPAWQVNSGWAVIRYEDAIISNYGRTSFNVSYIQANGYYRASFESARKFDTAIDWAYKKNLESYAGKLKMRRDMYINAISSASSSHAALQVNVEACGKNNPFDRTGGSRKGKIRVLVRYIGTNDDIAREVNDAMRYINSVAQKTDQHPPPVQNQLSPICQTNIMWCQMNVMVPVGTSCVCFSPQTGQIPGLVVPTK